MATNPIVLILWEIGLEGPQQTTEFTFQVLIVIFFPTKITVFFLFYKNLSRYLLSMAHLE